MRAPPTLNRLLLGLLTSMALCCTTSGTSTRRDPNAPVAASQKRDAALDAGRGCFRACMDARQMEARGIDTIEADCRKECQVTPNAYPTP